MTGEVEVEDLLTHVVVMKVEELPHLTLRILRASDSPVCSCAGPAFNVHRFIETEHQIMIQMKLDASPCSKDAVQIQWFCHFWLCQETNREARAMSTLDLFPRQSRVHLIDFPQEEYALNA